MVLPGRLRVFLPYLPPSFLLFCLERIEETRVWEDGQGEGRGRMVGAAVICKSFIYVWHLHNEAGSQWQH